MNVDIDRHELYSGERRKIMGILLVGGDKIDKIAEKLIGCGFQDIAHISGRKNGDKRLKIPAKTDLVLVLVDFVSHDVAEIMKEQSKKYAVKIAFSKRSWTHMEKTVHECAKEIKNAKKVII